ncbi:MAG TPA: helix-turn-helix transcriptional regulator [Candidatus Binataceae bacterium]|nr:helix-turn-helix transcriptional regulator [Candidatus Binataceae bacterium]
MDESNGRMAVETGGVGPLLRRWRESRHLSQLDLALEAEVSSRHISFLETGRAMPSREMLLTLANVLDVPLRERNLLLLAAGYAPVYRETSLDDPRMSNMRAALELILSQHEPRSAFAFDRYWNLAMVNAAFVRFITAVAGEKAEGLVPLKVLNPSRHNLLHLMFDPGGIRKLIVNWQPIAKSLLNQAHQMAAWSRDDRMHQLIADVLSYPGVPANWREPDLEAQPALVLPFEIDFGGGRIARMFSTVTTLSAPQDVTLQELHIEAFYPADEATKAMSFYND